MGHYSVKVSSGKRGAAAEHSRYDARIGKYEKREDLLSIRYQNMPSWAKDDPLKLWRAADKYERKNAAAYIEVIVALPNPLSLDQNKDLSEEIANLIAPGLPRQVAIHAPESSLEGVPNPHMHLMFTARRPDGIERGPERFFARHNAKNPEKGGCKKERGGLTRREMGEYLTEMRRNIAIKQNEALEKAGIKDRVDHRSNAERGISRQSEAHLGPAKIRRMTKQERQAFVIDRKAREDQGGGG